MYDACILIFAVLCFSKTRVKHETFLTMIELFGYALTGPQCAVLILAAILVGMAKTGVAGASMIIVPIMAIAFGSRDSTGLLLTILIFADLFAVWYYHRHASWHHLRRLLPYALLGVVVGTLVGQVIDDNTFRFVMAVIIFLSLGIMIWQEVKTNVQVPTSRWFSSSIGVAGGFTTMVGNLAGPVMALYLLAMRFPKNQFIGTAAWFFLSINLFKLPFHIWVWGTVTPKSFLLTTLFIPVIAVGAFLGIWVVKRINETAYRWFVIAMTGVAAFAMLINN